MILRVKPLHPLFAAESSTVDLRRPLDSNTIRGIERAVDRYGVIVFRVQRLDEDQLVAFGRQFGPLGLGVKKAVKFRGRLKHEETADISNIDGSGGVALAKIISQLPNRLWHADGQSQMPPSRYSMLNSVVVPPGNGGDTEFADLRAAYDALPPRIKRELKDLRVWHDALHGRIYLGETEWAKARRKAIPPVQWPLVRTHPGSRRKFVFVAVHAIQIAGMHVGLSRVLLDELLEHVTQRKFVYRHRWKAGDLVMWDNRCIIHRGLRYDPSRRRELRRVNTEETAAPEEMSA
jgi:alpha-ketoglutarate-dependent 2,4-dichlorophenoxyacetate dioxygenase